MKKKATGSTVRRKEGQGTKCQAFSRSRKMLPMTLAGAAACKDLLTRHKCALGRCRGTLKGSECQGGRKSSFTGLPACPLTLRGFPLESLVTSYPVLSKWGLARPLLSSQGQA